MGFPQLPRGALGLAQECQDLVYSGKMLKAGMPCRASVGVEMTAFGGHCTSGEMVLKLAAVLAHENACWRCPSVRRAGWGRGPGGGVWPVGLAGHIDRRRCFTLWGWVRPPRERQRSLGSGCLGALTCPGVWGRPASLSSHHSPPIPRPLYFQRHLLLFP